MDPQLKSAIRQLLLQLGAAAPGFLRSAVSPKLYEIYVLSLLVRAFRMLNATIDVRDSRGHPTTRLQFRLGGGRIYSPATAPGFILVRYDGKDFEIQNGVRVKGNSGILHELDVSLIDHVKATKCRQNREDPSTKDVFCLMECKFYGGDLDLPLGREFVGLAKEFSVHIRSFSSNEGSSSVARLVKKHGGFENFYLSPLNPNYVDGRFVPWLAEQLRHTLSDN